MELKNKKSITQELKEEAKAGTVTFVYSSKDQEHNNAVAFKKNMEKD